MRKVSLLLLVAAVSMVFTGCATVRRPGQIPEISLESVGKFQEGLSAELVNNQPNTTPEVYSGVWPNYLKADYNEWTQFFINELKKELERRGVKINSGSSNKVKVKISNFTTLPGFATIRVRMGIRVEIPSKNWVKDWSATDVSGWNDGRAFGSTIHNAIKELLQDETFIKALN